MHRPASRDDVDHVNSHILAMPGVARGQFGHRGRDPTQSEFVDRQGRLGRSRPGLDLDERDEVAATGNQVDFARPAANPAVEDSPALKAQPPGRDRLGSSPAPLGGRAGQRFFSSSSARA